MRIYYKRRCKGALGSTRNIVKSKIGVTSSRLKELEDIEMRASYRTHDKALIVKVVNLDPFDIDYLLKVGLEATCVDIGEESWKEATEIFNPNDHFDVVLLKIKGDKILDIEKCIIALSFMTNIPVAIIAKPGTEAAKDALSLTAGSMPVFNLLEEAVQSIKTTIPNLLHLRDLVQNDIASKVAKYKKVNVVKHFGTRAAVALIPFAVTAVNIAGLIRLVKRMMHKTGMVVSKEVAKTVGGQSMVASAQAYVIDEMGDWYQFAVAAAIVADVQSTLFNEGIGPALSALDAVDFALLGSVSLVTGTLAAIGACLTRPQLVDGISKFLAALQVMYLLNPEIRRPVKDTDTIIVDDGASDGSDGQEELDESDRELLRVYEREHPSGWPDQEYAYHPDDLSHQSSLNSGISHEDSTYRGVGDDDSSYRGDQYGAHQNSGLRRLFGKRQLTNDDFTQDEQPPGGFLASERERDNIPGGSLAFGAQGEEFSFPHHEPLSPASSLGAGSVELQFSQNLPPSVSENLSPRTSDGTRHVRFT